jgi:type III restriction enzyme
MAKAVIAYDKDLPEIPDRCYWEIPTSFLVKDAAAPNGWREDKSGRRTSMLMLVKKVRHAVDQWRAKGYPGCSDVTRRLFEYWFEEDHDVKGFPVPFRYRFCLREGIETLAYLVEIFGQSDTKDLIDKFAEVFKKDLFAKNIEFQTTMDGRRQIRRYVPELDADGVQDLPIENLRRYALKMATGSGKTWVIAMAIVWAHFHKKRVKGSDLSTNFLIVAPNVIVYQRLEKDFASNQIFHELPLIPPEWRGLWSQKVILRGESAEPDPSGNLFLTNIQQLYEARQQEWTPENAIDAILGPKPNKDLSSYQRSMLERMQDLKDLIVINDEAHHVHDEDLAWTQSLLSIHRALPNGLSLWLDFSATPKDQNGMYFPWTVCDYPLAQAVEDRIVKAPIIVTKEDDPRQPTEDPDGITKDNVCEKYGYWIQAAVQRWKEHHKTYTKLGTKPVLFIMAEKNVYADALGKYLVDTKEFGFKESEVLVIHTDEAGEVTKKDLDKAREAARDIDKPGNKIKAIVSVMMLREGWDVRSVSVVLGLRPFTAKAEILPEQVIGRGLRLMVGIGPDRTQTLEVLGTRNLLNVLRSQLEAEGVGIATSKSDPPKPVIVEPVRDRLAYDIAIPITKPRLSHNVRKLSSLDPNSFDAIYDQKELDENIRVNLRMEFATTETEVHQDGLANSTVPFAQELLGSIANKVMQRARLANVFSELYPIVRQYVGCRCFGKLVDVDDEKIRAHLHRLDLREGIAKYLARKISELTVEKATLQFENANFKLSDTMAFSWRRNLPPLVAKRTVFNFVATYNDFERKFAEFLDNIAPDVVRFASLGTTEQGESGTAFRVDYLKPSGAIGFYHPDWVVVQLTADGEVNWIIETKGRIWEDTKAKEAAMHEWCARVSEQTGQIWQHARINQIEFTSLRPKTLADAITGTRRSNPELPI